MVETFFLQTIKKFTAGTIAIVGFLLTLIQNVVHFFRIGSSLASHLISENSDKNTKCRGMGLLYKIFQTKGLMAFTPELSQENSKKIWFSGIF